MAKYRHRIFEMYDFFDEALRVLTSQGQQTTAAVPIPESCVFTHLAASRCRCDSYPVQNGHVPGG